MFETEPKREVSNVIYVMNMLAFAVLLFISIVEWGQFFPLWISVPIFGAAILVNFWYLLRNLRGHSHAR